MDISNATRVADFASGIGTEGAIIKVDDDNDRIGIGTNNPQTTLQVGTGVSFYGNGIIRATAFYGDGSNLTNAGSSLDASSGLQRVLVTSQTSGNMTAVATDTGLLFNTSTNTLVAANVSIAGTLTYEDVTNIDSLGIVTARTGVKVTAGGINAVGVVTATSFSGDGSNLDGVESGVVNFVASGNIDNGKTVIIKDDGTVGIVTQTGNPESCGSDSNWGITIGGNATIYDPDEGKIVIAYKDSNNNYGMAVVGTVSGTSISFGTPVQINAANTESFGIAYDTANDKIVISYRDNGNNGYGTAIVGTVSGTSISFGSSAVFFSSEIEDQASAVYDPDEGRVVIAFRDNTSPHYGKAVVGTVSGTSISYGSAVTFESALVKEVRITYDSTNNKVVIVYQDYANSRYGTAVVGTVSGTSISFGTPAVFNSNGETSYIGTTFDSTNGKVVIAYKDEGSTGKPGTSIVGTVSGTDITFGTPVVFNSAEPMSTVLTFNTTLGKVLLSYEDEDNSRAGTVQVGTVSGTDISYSDPFAYNAGQSDFAGITYDSSNDKAVITYRDAGNSYYGSGIVYTFSTIATNLTTENYIGIAGEAIANAATGKVNVIGGVNSGQSGLTTAQTYYVGQTGILTTTADTPSVVAGTSISSTKISVR